MGKFVKYKDLIYIHCFGPNDDNFASNKADIVVMVYQIMQKHLDLI